MPMADAAPRKPITMPSGADHSSRGAKGMLNPNIGHNTKPSQGKTCKNLCRNKN